MNKTTHDMPCCEPADEDTADCYPETRTCPTFIHACQYAHGEAGDVECVREDCVCLSAPTPLSIDQLIARLRVLKDEEMLRQYHTGLDSATPRLIRLATAITALHQIEGTGRI